MTRADPGNFGTHSPPNTSLPACPQTKKKLQLQCVPIAFKSLVRPASRESRGSEALSAENSRNGKHEGVGLIMTVYSIGKIRKAGNKQCNESLVYLHRRMKSWLREVGSQNARHRNRRERLALGMSAQRRKNYLLYEFCMRNQNDSCRYPER
ncbi:hypothetical protein M426DRAFT_244805 [Hypoxylon sp. CI-4A]|nr:hypothetical protein M426DRAFT_244805 [Hypoxylon sp. CI-4A]